MTMTEEFTDLRDVRHAIDVLRTELREKFEGIQHRLHDQRTIFIVAIGAF